MPKRKTLRIAVLDLYEGEANEGMRGIRQLIEEFEADNHFLLEYEIFDVRLKNQVPGLGFDAYISSGGPGSPLSSEGSEWERKYFGWMNDLRSHNAAHPQKKRPVLLICHSFQIFCRYYSLATVNRRRSPAFGVMPVHRTPEGKNEPLFAGLADPFWVVESRDFQILQPDLAKIRKGGGNLLCIEKSRPHVALERAVMAIRFDDSILGMQFHPEADAAGIRMYLLKEDKKKLVIQKRGEKKYWEMLDHLNDPDKIMLTYHTIVPAFLKALMPVESPAVS